MTESKKQFLQGLPICGVFALAAGLSTLLFHVASDYTTHYTALKVYFVGWFSACVLSFYCGLLVVPRSLGIIFSFAGLVAFAILCALDEAMLANYPLLDRGIQVLPAMLFIAAWAAIAISACRSDKRKIRLSAWVWLCIFLIMLACWVSFQVAQYRLLERRNKHLAEAREKTLYMVQLLNDYKQQHDTYPDTLDTASIDSDTAKLSYRNKRIKYFGHDSDFVLAFDDPMVSNQSAFSYDTLKEGWFPSDPKDALTDKPKHLFLGFLRRK